VNQPPIIGDPNNRVRIVVAMSVMLTLFSYWRAAAIILNDLGSSAFYVGIAEEAVGKSALWLIIGVILFSFTILNASGDLRRSANQVCWPAPSSILPYISAVTATSDAHDRANQVFLPAPWARARLSPLVCTPA
jgi:hypothetical protein